MIWVVDSDLVMAECVARAITNWTGGGAGRVVAVNKLGEEKAAESVPHIVPAVRIYHDVADAVNGLSEGVPELIFLEVMLVGWDGFTLLNELRSYEDTMRVPVVIVSERDFAGWDLSAYGVVGVLNKETMYPEEIRQYVVNFTGVREELSA